MQLLSSVEPIISFMFSFQSKSTTLERCPSWVKNAYSYSFDSISTSDRSQICTFLSYPHDANKFIRCGLHSTLTTLSLLLKLVRDLVKFLMSHMETVSSPEPLRNKN